jgi:lysine-specific demethylase 8
MRVVGNVERVSELSAEVFQREYVRPGKPVILSNALSSWRAPSVWTGEYLKQAFGDRRFQFKSSTSDAHPDFYKRELREMFAREALTFEEFLVRISSGPMAERARLLFSGDEHFLYRVREGAAQLNPELAVLWRDVAVPELVPQARLYTVWAWFSGPGVRTWLHYDNNGCHNMNAQVSGSKRALLFPPDALDKVGLFPLGGPNPATNCSQIDVQTPDLGRFPEFAAAEALSAELRPGDLLFIPVNWLHSFVHLGDFNANVNFWWKPGTEVDDPVARRERQSRGAY